MREDEFRRKIVKLAHLHGWKVAYWHRLPTKGQEWRTPVGGDAKGFPDLTLARDPRLIFVELKGERGRLAPEQKEWLNLLALCGAEVYVWKPKDYEHALLVLGDERQFRIEQACGGDSEQAAAVGRMLG